MALHSFESRTQAASFAASLIFKEAERAVAERGICRIALSGGSTPRTMLSALFEMSLPWDRVHIFQVDERCVPPDSPDSNYSMLRRSLQAPAVLSDCHMHRIHGELSSPELAAQRYELDIATAFDLASFPAAWDSDDFLSPPVFDCIHLGMGDDGHVASLFPDSPHLQESRRWVLPVPAPEHAVPGVARVSMTLPLLNSASTLLILLAGQNKMKRMSSLPRHPELPAAQLRSGPGVFWVVSP